MHNFGEWELLQINAELIRGAPCYSGKQMILHKIHYDLNFIDHLLNDYVSQDRFTLIYGIRCPKCKKNMPESLVILRNLLNG